MSRKLPTWAGFLLVARGRGGADPLAARNFPGVAWHMENRTWRTQHLENLSVCSLLRPLPAIGYPLQKEA